MKRNALNNINMYINRSTTLSKNTDLSGFGLALFYRQKWKRVLVYVRSLQVYTEVWDLPARRHSIANLVRSIVGIVVKSQNVSNIVFLRVY